MFLNIKLAKLRFAMITYHSISNNLCLGKPRHKLLFSMGFLGKLILYILFQPSPSLQKASF
jgi:hypothetical protein